MNRLNDIKRRFTGMSHLSSFAGIRYALLDETK